jgi:hypothetical protein
MSTEDRESPKDTRRYDQENVYISRETMRALRELEGSELETQKISDHEIFFALLIQEMKEAMDECIHHVKYDRIQSRTLKRSIDNHFSKFMESVKISLDVNVMEMMYEYAHRFRDNNNEESKEKDQYQKYQKDTKNDKPLRWMRKRPST